MQRQSIGEAVIDSILEMRAPMRTVPELLPGCTDDMIDAHRDWLVPNCIEAETGLVIVTHQSFLLRAAGLTILIDTCVGEDKNRPHQPYFHQKKFPMLANLAAAGVRPEEVDLVMCTHLHVDHVGWNTRLRDGKWVPTFPNARYLFSRTDFEYWERQHLETDWLTDAFTDSVLPIMEAGLADLVEGDHQIRDGLWLEPLPGHSPGLVELNLESKGERAIFCGDVMHHPIQVPEPGLSSIFCEDPVQAAETRTAFVAEHADTATLILPTHFSDESCGRIVSGPKGCVFKFGG